MNRDCWRSLRWKRIFLLARSVPELEKLVRFHYEMDINLEGIEAIHHLLQQMKTMQDEMKALKTGLAYMRKLKLNIIEGRRVKHIF